MKCRDPVIRCVRWRGFLVGDIACAALSIRNTRTAGGVAQAATTVPSPYDNGAGPRHNTRPVAAGVPLPAPLTPASAASPPRTPRHSGDPHSSARPPPPPPPPPPHSA